MSRAISTLTSTSISMASASSLLLALVLQGPPQGPAPAPLRLSFAAAVRQATGATDSAPAAVAVAGLRPEEAHGPSAAGPLGAVAESVAQRLVGQPILQHEGPGPLVPRSADGHRSVQRL